MGGVGGILLGTADRGVGRYTMSCRCGVRLLLLGDGLLFFGEQGFGAGLELLEHLADGLVERGSGAASGGDFFEILGVLLAVMLGTEFHLGENGLDSGALAGV